MERRPEIGELYRHFKGRLYQVIAVAKHSETGEELVIYQAMYGDFQVYARPLAMFVSEVDRVKYPQVEQQYRFEKVDRRTLAQAPADAEQRSTDTHAAPAAGDVRSMPRAAMPKDMRGTQAEAVARRMREVAASRAEQEKQEQQERSDQSGGVSPRLMEFFDAKSMEERYNILVSMRDEVDDHMINSMAVVMDVVIPEGELSERYEQLKRCVRTRQRYETERLR